MERVIEKAGTLIEALPYIQRFRGTTTVIKFGGSAMDSMTALRSALTDIVFMSVVGMRPVVVHGGGKAISAAMEERGLDARFVSGLRITDKAAIEVVRRVLDEQVNPELVNMLTELGAAAQGISGREVFRARRMTVADKDKGTTFDIGYVGEVVGVDAGPIEAALARAMIPVVSPLATGDADGETYNLNADVAAAEAAVRMRVAKLVFLSDVPGILTRAGDDASLLSTLHVNEVENLIHEGVIQGGMMPKVRGATKAIKSGVGKTHIIDGRLRHSLLLEIFTDAGVGTEIVQ